MRRLSIYLMVMVAGVAALSWELLWQLKASLSLGISALGAAIILAATMGGMTVGALTAGRFLANRQLINRPLRIYGALELIIGVSGLFLITAFDALEWLDSAIYTMSPALAPAVHSLGIVLLLGLPTVAMGATLPVFGLVARAYGTSISMLYGLNAGGGAIGVLLMAFVVLPSMGVSTTVRIVASFNLLVALGTILFRPPSLSVHGDAGMSNAGSRIPSRTHDDPPRQAPPHAGARIPSRTHDEPLGQVQWPIATLIVFTTGLATFVLEVAWFRAMRAAFMSTTKSFAIILASVIVPLAIAACVVPWLHRRGLKLGPFLAAAAPAILIATPVLERLDVLCINLQRSANFERFNTLMLSWFGLSLAIIGPAVLLLGIALPWLLQGQNEPRHWGRLYAVNTVSAMIGAICAAWILLPTIGFARTTWLTGVLVGLVALVSFRGAVRWIGAAALLASLAVSIMFESGLGRLRVQGQPTRCEVLAYEEAPDATVSVIAAKEFGARELIIDGCHTASEHERANYMMWMGRLPMLAHSDPKRALVIGFGSGQTANAVRQQAPERLDVVELSSAVYRMAGHFKSNENVLDDPRVRAIVMDGRAWLRRSSELYDVVTLEPMPPYFANSNALYSKEFYELIATRLTPHGVAAQWVPLHLLPPYYATSVVSTFRAIFPHAILWIDPKSGTGILVGRRNGDGESSFWQGLDGQSAPDSERDRGFLETVALEPAGVERYAAWGDIITDDNQLLSYGDVRQGLLSFAGRMTVVNLNLVRKASGEGWSRGVME